MTFENQLIEIIIQLMHIKAISCGILFMLVCIYLHNVITKLK
jgi:hypothetical protein